MSDDERMPTPHVRLARYNASHGLQLETDSRVMIRYNFVTRECWLDTKYGDVPRECPMSRVNSSTIPSADCVTYFKKTTEKELQEPQYGPTSMDEDSTNKRNSILA